MPGGDIKDLREVSPDDFDALVLPGGFGAALNLCTFAEKGSSMEVDPDVQQFLKAMHESKKPIGAICIAPVILAKVFGSLKVKVTIGTDKNVASVVEEMGASHVTCPESDCCTDEQNLLVTTPAFMLAQNSSDMYQGIKKLAEEVVRLTRV